MYFLVQIAALRENVFQHDGGGGGTHTDMIAIFARDLPQDPWADRSRRENQCLTVVWTKYRDVPDVAGGRSRCVEQEIRIVHIEQEIRIIENQELAVSEIHCVFFHVLQQGVRGGTWTGEKWLIKTER